MEENKGIEASGGPPKADRSVLGWLLVLILRVFLPVAIVTAGAFYAVHLLQTKPKAQRRPPARQARPVEVIEVERVDVPLKVHAYGSIIAAREVVLKPQVSGKVLQISPEVMPGGLFRAGQTVLEIESEDYKLIVRQRDGDLAKVQKDLRLEQGSQSVARQEYELLGEEIVENDRELVLRQPQLVSAEAAVDAARARLEQARLDLKRTAVVAPFNAVVKSKSVDLGAMVTSASTLATLTGTDEYWCELAVSVADLQWILIPPRDGATGSTVRIYNTLVWGEDAYRIGRVIRLSGELETEGRMARLLISIKDPLSLTEENASAPRVLIGSYVRGEIECKTIRSVVSLDRQLLRDGDNVWVMTADETLDIRPVEIVFRGENNVLVANGIDAGDRVLTTDLGAPVPGMPLRLRDDESGETTSEGSQNSGLSAQGEKNI